MQPHQPKQSTSPASSLLWLSEALAALRRQPLALTGVVVFNLLASGILSGMPFIGTLLASCWMPFGAVLTGIGAREALAGRIPSYRVLADAWRDTASRYALLSLGVFSAIWFEVETLVFTFLGRDAIANWKISAEGLDFASVTANLPTGAFIAAGLLYIPFLMLSTFAPLLVVEKRQKFGKSLFYSFFGSLKHLVPLALFVMILLAITAALAFVFEGFFAAMGMEGGIAFFAPFVVAFISTISQASVWMMFRDIFGKGEPR